MVEIGFVIEAVVTHVEHYGVFLRHDGEEVIVLIPEFSWRPVKNLRDVVRVGDRLKVLVLRYNYKKRQIVASVRRLHQEDNPYRELSRLPPGEVLEGTVTFAAGEDLTIRLPNGAWGDLPKRSLGREASVGDKVNVEVEALEVDEGRLTLAPAGSAVEAVR
ncbi:MAG TPA: S1 RNA-binding domain-containing protein [Gemmataceae bacterium]|nr:S1 RNA-binding domain-containing protein [Gemmataceae bacterium]